MTTGHSILGKTYPFDFSLKGTYLGSKETYIEGEGGPRIVLLYKRSDGIFYKKELDTQLELSVETYFQSDENQPIVVVRWEALGCFARSFYDEQGKLVFVYKKNQNDSGETEIWYDGEENMLAQRHSKNGMMKHEFGASLILYRMYRIERREYWDGQKLHGIHFWHPTKGFIAKQFWDGRTKTGQSICAPNLLDLLDLSDWKTLGINDAWVQEIQNAENSITRAGSFFAGGPKELREYALKSFNKKAAKKHYKNEKSMSFRVPKEIADDFKTIIGAADYSVQDWCVSKNFEFLSITWK